MDDSLLPFTSLRENLTQADLDFLIFGQRNKNRHGFGQFDSQKIKNHLLPPESIYNKNFTDLIQP